MSTCDGKKFPDAQQRLWPDKLHTANNDSHKSEYSGVILNFFRGRDIHVCPLKVTYDYLNTTIFYLISFTNFSKADRAK